jgi:hypothetical protein
LLRTAGSEASSPFLKYLSDILRGCLLRFFPLKYLSDILKRVVASIPEGVACSAPQEAKQAAP